MSAKKGAKLANPDPTFRMGESWSVCHKISLGESVDAGARREAFAKASLFLDNPALPLIAGSTPQKIVALKERTKNPPTAAAAGIMKEILGLAQKVHSIRDKLEGESKAATKATKKAPKEKGGLKANAKSAKSNLKAEPAKKKRSEPGVDLRKVVAELVSAAERDFDTEAVEALVKASIKLQSSAKKGKKPAPKKKVRKNENTPPLFLSLSGPLSSHPSVMPPNPTPLLCRR